MKVVITDFINLGKSQRKKLEQIPNITIYGDTLNDPKTIIDRIKDVDVVTANFIDFTKEIIENAPKLKYIISPAKGYDWIDSKTATEKGVKILNCPTFNAQAVAEHAIALMFAVKRKIIQANQSILRGEYDPKKFVGTEVSSKLLVTIGHGQIGKRVLKMAEGLDMSTAFADSKTSREELCNLISKADVLVLCLPVTEKTKKFFDKELIKLMKKSSILINVARGLVVNYEDLTQALQKNEVAGAGIDTFTKDETITVPNDEIATLAKLPNVVATPHMAYNTEEAAERLGEELIANIKSCLENKPINVVN